jgi:hypothetical protein
MKNILKADTVVGKKTHLRRYKSHFEWQKTKIYCKFWSNSKLLNQDPHSQYGSGSITAKAMRILIHNTAQKT